jgi:hypothetical protein
MVTMRFSPVRSRSMNARPGCVGLIRCLAAAGFVEVGSGESLTWSGEPIDPHGDVEVDRSDERDATRGHPCTIGDAVDMSLE